MENSSAEGRAKTSGGDDDGRDSAANSGSSCSQSPTSSSSSDNNFFHSNTDAIDEILADFQENTTAAPRAEMEGDSSDEDPAAAFQAKPTAVDAQGPLPTTVEEEEEEEADVIQTDRVQHTVFAVHFNLSTVEVDVGGGEGSPTGGRETDAVQSKTFIDDNDLVQLLDNAKFLDQHILSTAGITLNGERIDTDIEQNITTDTTKTGGGGGDGQQSTTTAAVILSTKIDNKNAALRNSNYDLCDSSSSFPSPSPSSNDDTMYVYEVRRSEKEGSERGPDRVKTTRVYIRFSGQNVDGLIEHEEMEEAEEVEEGRGYHLGGDILSSSESMADQELLSEETVLQAAVSAVSEGGAAISQRGSPLKSLNENSNDVERSLEESQDQPPEIPPLPVGGLPPIVRAPGSEEVEENEEVEEEKEQVEFKSIDEFKTSSKPSLASYFPGKGSEKERNGNDEEQREEDAEISGGSVQAFPTEKSFTEFPSKTQTDQPQVDYSKKKKKTPAADSLLRHSGLPNGQPPQDAAGSYEQGDLGSRCRGDRQQVAVAAEVKRKERDFADDAAAPVASASIAEDEFPPASFLQKLLNKFRQMERESARNQPSPLKAKSAPSTPIRRPVSQEDEDGDSEERGQASAGADPRRPDVTPGYAATTTTTTTTADESPAAAAVDEFPQKGLAKNLLAQWRMLEAQELRAREREEQRRKVSVATRSHSLSRIEEAQRMLYEGGKSVTTTTTRGHGGHGGGDDADSFTESSLMSASDDGQGLLLSSFAVVSGAAAVGSMGSIEGAYDDDDYLPPPLMTKYVLAKFRDLEAESKIIAGIQPKLKKNFKWEVKESLPLIRGGLIVHGDLPRGKSGDVVRHPERKRSVSEPSPATTTTTTTHGTEDADNSGDEDEKEEAEAAAAAEEEEKGDCTAAGRDGELPPPEMTKALLAHFRSIEETHSGMVEVKPKQRLESRSRGPPSRSEGAGGDSGSAREQQLDPLSPSLESSFDRGEVASSSDLSVVDEFPEQGTTRSLLAKFQLMQSNP